MARRSPTPSHSEPVARGMQATFHDAMEPLRGEWDDLADRVEASPFQRPGWLIAWWRAFGAGGIRVLALRHDGRLVGLAPLCRRRGVLRSTTNAHTPEFGPLVEDSYALELVKVLFERPRRRVTLEFLAPSRPDLDDYRAVAAEQGYRLIHRTFERSPYIATDGGWPAYESSLNNKLRSDLRRRRRRLEESGTVSWESHAPGEGLDAFLEEGYRVEASGWKGSEGTAILCRPETRQFYTEVARWAAARGWLRLRFLRLDGVPLAFEYALQEGNAYYRIKGGFDPEYAAFAPGKLLVHQTIKWAFDQSLARYHFLGHDEPYKMEWADTSTVYPLLHAFGRTFLGRLEWAAYAYVRPLAVRIGLRR